MLAIYTRLSREDSESTSIENQLREGKSFAKDNGFNDIKIYNEGQGISGAAEIKHRPQLFKLLQDIRDNEIKSVWFRNQNRLERNSSTWHIFTLDAKKHKVDIYFNDKLFDFENPQDNLFGTITSALNQYQKDLQSLQTKRTLKDNAREGKVWSVVAYGYKSDNGLLAIDELEAEIVKEIYNLSLSGIGAGTIANRLNKRGVPTRKNKLFRPHTIQTIIKNPLYKGERKYSGEVFTSPIIIEPNLWQKVNDNLKKNRNNSGKKVEHKYLLKGLLMCGDCGRNYYGRKRLSGKDNSYICSSRRHKDLPCCNKGIFIPFIEELIWGQLFTKSLFLKAYQDFISSNDNDSKILDIKKENDDIDIKISKNNKKVNKLLDLFLVDEDDLNTDLKKLFNSKINSIQENVKTLKGKKNNNLDEIKQYENYIDSSIIDLLNKDYLNPSFNTKKELVNLFINKIIITFDEIDSVGIYYIEILPKIKGMDSILYAAPFSKKYAIEINNLIFEDVELINQETILNMNIFIYGDKKDVEIKVRMDNYKYFLNNIKTKEQSNNIGN